MKSEATVGFELDQFTVSPDTVIERPTESCRVANACVLCPTASVDVERETEMLYSDGNPTGSVESLEQAARIINASVVFFFHEE